MAKQSLYDERASDMVINCRSGGVIEGIDQK